MDPKPQTFVDKMFHKKFAIALFTAWRLSTMYSPDNDWKFNALLVVAIFGITMGTVYCQMKLDEKDEPITS